MFKRSKVDEFVSNRNRAVVIGKNQAQKSNNKEIPILLLMKVFPQADKFMITLKTLLLHIMVMSATLLAV